MRADLFADYDGPRRRVELATRQCLFRQGDTSTGPVVVVSGRMRLLRHLEDGSQVTLFDAPEGSVLALAALFSPVYHCTARAESPSVLSWLDRKGVRSWLEADSAKCLEVIGSLSREIQNLRMRLEVLRIRSAKERLLAYLSILAVDQHVDVNRPWTQVASEINLSQETVYRALAALEREGRLERPAEGQVRLIRL